MNNTEQKPAWHSLLDQAQATFRRGEFEAAEALLEQALSAAKRDHGEHSSHMAVLLSELAECYEAQGKESQAEECFRQVRTILKARKPS